eukprot:10949202-Prorocentrum_lima.AAC.1
MTSSLVGSEMCIRDRTRARAPRKMPRVRGPAQPREGEGSRVQNQIGPVSYTHLTLPTICSV